MRKTLTNALCILILIIGAVCLYLFWTAYRTSSGGSVVTVSTSTAQGASSTTATIPVATHSVQIPFDNGKTITLTLPSTYSITLAAQGYRSLRFMAWSPDQRLFVGEMTNASDNTDGRVLVFDGFDPASGAFKDAHTYLSNLRNPNSVAFYKDASGQEWIYVVLTDKLVRYPYAAGDNTPHEAPQTIATFPDYGQPASEGGWHLTRTLAFDGDKLFVSVGSGCNSCEEPGVVRADILEMNPDGSDSHVYASGLRNAVGITVVNGILYATANEADHLGNDRPNDLVYAIQEGANYGWPYCYEFDSAVYPDTTQQWLSPISCATVPLAFAELEPHSAPLGITYFNNSFADPNLRGAFLVAEHGSGKPGIGTGYMVSVVRQGSFVPFITGFLRGGTRVARPVDVLQYDDRSFFLTDDLNGAIYYVQYQ